MEERRLDDRLLCADMVEVEWTDDRGEFRIETALLEDIAPQGVCVQMESALPECSVVVLNLAGRRVRAMVQYCLWREIGYFAGLQFAPGSEWSSEQFAPQHLTNPLAVQSCRVRVIV